MDHVIHMGDNTKLIDSIVCEVKSQGVFDQLRRECMADVDTKPAYQNLRQRVESSVTSFLNEQEWRPDLNKNQLRERLRRNITETGFLETGVERIVDQVVNPKINTIFLPKIEEIAYKYLGIDKPKPSESKLAAMSAAAAAAATDQANGYIEVNTDFLPTDLEAVSPDSDRSHHNKSSTSMDNNSRDNLNESGGSVKLELLNDSADKIDDFESPAFEPIEGRLSSDMSIKDEDGDNSKLSGISGLTSQDSLESNANDVVQNDEPNVQLDVAEDHPNTNGCNTPTLLAIATEIPAPPQPPPPPPPPLPATHEPVEGISSDNAVHNKVQFINLTDQFNQDSVLSQVSSNSHLSIVTNNSDSNTNHKSPSVDMSEEAQMPKFNESSSSDSNNHVANANNSNSMHQPSIGIRERKPLMTSFDIKQDEIKFEGTDRRQSIGMEIKEEIEQLEAMKSTTKMPPLPSPVALDVPLPPMDVDEPLVKTDSSSSSIAAETKNLSLVDINEPAATELPALNAVAEYDAFKFEAPTPSGDSVKCNSNQPITEPESDTKIKDSHKSRRRDRDHRSSSDKLSSNNRDKKYQSSVPSKQSSNSSSKDRRGKDEMKRNDEDKKFGSHRSSTSKSHHHSSTYSSQHQSSQSSSKDRSRPNSRTSSSNHQHTDSKSTDRDKKRDSGESSRSHKKNDEKRDGDKSRKSLDSNSPKKSDKPNGNIDDDHSSYREKPIDRRRSTDRDSNDGQSNPGSSSSLNRGAVDSGSVSSTLSSKTSANTSPSVSTDASQQQATNDSITLSEDNFVEMPSIHDVNHPMFLQPNSTESEEDFLLPTLPIVVDQILTGNEINLELLIGQKSIDPVLTTIQQTLTDGALKMKKPKVASNIFEARRLMKVRKQMEREEKKRIEQAMVLVKQYISSNSVMANSYGIADQGVELEFACITSDDSPAPSISSPIKSISPTHNAMPSSAATATSDDFYGFTENDALKEPSIFSLSDDQKKVRVELLQSHYRNAIFLINPDDVVVRTIKKTSRHDIYIIEGKTETLISKRRTSTKAKTKLKSETGSGYEIAITQLKHLNVTEGISFAQQHEIHNNDIQQYSMQAKVTKQKSPTATAKPSRKRNASNNKRSALPTGVTTDNNNHTAVKQIKIDATIQMKTCHDHGEGSQAPADNAACVVNQQTVSGSQQNNTSPTPSDQSIGSKENNFVPKIKKAVSRSMVHNMSNNYVSSIPTPDHKDSIMVTSSVMKKASAAAGQRYSSDDLYKPRPILMGSRSRRRGYDNSDM